MMMMVDMIMTMMSVMMLMPMQMMMMVGPPWLAATYFPRYPTTPTPSCTPEMPNAHILHRLV